MSKSIKILDGGMSRELIRLEAPFKQPEWSALALMESPHLVRQVHDDFISAGAQIVTTNSYAIVPFHLGMDRFLYSGRQLAALAGRLAREAADAEKARSGRKVMVAGSLPPIFGSYEPAKFDQDKVQDYLSVLVESLEPYVDIWLAETLSLVQEAREVQSAVSHTQKPLWVAFTPDDSQESNIDTPRLRSGESIESVVEWAQLSSIDALLFNCCRPEYVEAALRIASASFAIPPKAPLLGVYANSFVPRANDYAANEDIAQTDAELTPAAYAEITAKWVASGASIIGGCCGIGHEHIRELSRLCSSKS